MSFRRASSIVLGASCAWAVLGASGESPAAAADKASLACLQSSELVRARELFTRRAVCDCPSACTSDGASTYPYGSTFDAAACAGTDLSIVGSHPACVGGPAGVLDMRGNVWEWTDTCTSAAADSFCDTFGGAFDSRPEELSCATERNWTRTAGAANIGIRGGLAL